MRSKVLVAVLVVGLATLILGTISAAPAAAYPAGWTLQQMPVSAGANSCDIEAFNEHVWLTYRTSSTGSIWITRSADFGATWEAPICIDNGVYETGNPVVIAGSPSLVYVLFSGKRDGGGYFQTQVYQGTDYGSTYTRIWHSTGNSDKTAADATRAPASNTIFWTFADDSSGVDEVSWGKITVNGVVTVSTSRSSVDGIASHQPTIAASGYSDVMIAWVDEGGGTFNRAHLVESHTGDGGVTWTGRVVPDGDNESGYRQYYPSLAWDVNTIVIVYQGQNLSTGDFFVGRFCCTPMGFNWVPGNVADSVYQNTAAVSCIPKVCGRFSADIFFKNSSSQLSNYSIATDFFGTKTIGANCSAISLASTNYSSDNAIDYVAGVSGLGEILVRRKDRIAPTSNITTPVFSGSGAVYNNSNFYVEAVGAADDYPVNGSDVRTGVSYHLGVEGIVYEYTVDENNWNPAVMT